uniref:Uncharacterized protein n=1 Tax=Knipowitschia caucasica TaxID=637954 RepID=A0AAV2KJX2_KNICA
MELGGRGLQNRSRWEGAAEQHLELLQCSVWATAPRITFQTSYADRTLRGASSPVQDLALSLDPDLDWAPESTETEEQELSPKSDFTH